MKFGIVSDIHSNLYALQAVLDHMSAQGVDKKVCLGDIVGYGANPNECISLAVGNFDYIVKGNHDQAISDFELAMSFTPLARSGIEWTKTQLSSGYKDILESLQYSHSVGDTLFVHGSPERNFAYIENQADAYIAFTFSNAEFKAAFVGHTHIPELWVKNTGSTHPSHVRLDFGMDFGKESSATNTLTDAPTIINVGAVGQPRDRDPRACYAVYDTETKQITHFRVPYDIDRTVARMQRCGFSNRAWMRLMYGE